MNPIQPEKLIFFEKFTSSTRFYAGASLPPPQKKNLANFQKLVKPNKKHHVSNEKKDCLGFFGDEILPSYVGITVNNYNYKDPVIKQPRFNGK